MLTLLILSLLIIVAVSYLTSMSSERQTADAYTSKARAEQVAQAGVDSAMAILTESFRDFPDSATVWDTQQSTNSGGSVPYNEGTSLYLRAVPTPAPSPFPTPAAGQASPTVVANPTPHPGSTAANDSIGNDPSNPACQNFVLPLVSGVPLGRARPVSQKTSILPPMNVTVNDPTQQNFVDLNVRRYAGDTQGIIGSPPLPAAASPSSTPKPARALWVNLKSKKTDPTTGQPAELTTGRYAFWIDDESFRANNNYFDNKLNTPPDNRMQPASTPAATPAPSPTPVFRSLQPSDSILSGTLTLAGDPAPTDAATLIHGTRQVYPGGFFPDPLAFVHSLTDGTSSFASPTTRADTLRYLMTNQSGALNLTRHGTQRLNLNDVVTTANPLQTQVDQIVQTMKFHLPYLGERFYRSSATNLTASALNDATQVPGSPVANQSLTLPQPSTHANIYYYKVAANLVDYIDTDSQPTLIDNTGHVVAPTVPPTGPLNADTSGKQIWAQGKEIAPYMQEVAVRYRPVVYDHQPYPPLKFDFQIDYYVEFWNMSDRDIYAGPNPNQPNLGGAMLHIGNQHPWAYYAGSPPINGTLQGPDGKTSPLITGPTDYDIDLTNFVYQGGSSTPVSGGVVFRAGTCTVITTDPDYMSYVFQGLAVTPMKSACPPAPTTTPATYPTINVATTYYCKHLMVGTLPGVRDYKGTVGPATFVSAPNQYLPGIQQALRNGAEDAELEIYLWNNSGVVDSIPFALTEYNPGYNKTPRAYIYTDTDKFAVPADIPGSYNDFSYSSCLFGNYTDGNLYYPATPSQLGDPRTNNEQITIASGYQTSLKGDQTRFVYPNGSPDTTLGYPNGLSQKPDRSDQGYPWPDYYILPTPTAANGLSYPSPDATNAPMVIADAPLTSIGQLGDVFDPARLPGANSIVYSRGGGRTFKVGQRDDRYSNDPTGNAQPNNTSDNVPASNGWAAWRLADVFDVADPIEMPARININGVLRDKGAALLSLLQGYVFQPKTTVAKDSNGNIYTPPTDDPIIHGDGHPMTTSSSLAEQSLDTTGSTNGFAALVAQMTARLSNSSPANGPSGPFFERGEFGELGVGSNALFGTNPASVYSVGNKLLVNTVDMNRAFDHGREELFRRIAQMICTRGDTFTVYAVGQSISQPTPTAPLKITGTHRMRVTFRLVPKAADPDSPGGFKDFHPSYKVDATTGATTLITSYTDLSDTTPTGRFTKPDHYDVQILQTNTF